MKRSPRIRAALCLAALALAACAGSYERSVEETRAGLIGKTGRELRACLGVPTDFDREGDVEFLTYRWVLTPKRGAATSAIGSGGVGGIVIGRQGAGGGGDPLGFPRDPGEAAFCQIDFELAVQGVVKVTASGRDDVGMSANGECLMRARRCVDASDGD
ncbi:MAG: hypothetical protein ACHQ6T_19435 [Myxococcota bacterium]